MQTSADGGATWTEPRTVFDGTAESPRRTVVTGGVVPTKSGSPLLACGVVEGLEPGVLMFDAAAADRPMYVLTRRSADGGRTWTPAALYEVWGEWARVGGGAAARWCARHDRLRGSR